MISPLVSYALSGAIWYQGESNTNNPTMYSTLLPMMIENWSTRRKGWYSKRAPEGTRSRSLAATSTSKKRRLRFRDRDSLYHILTFCCRKLFATRSATHLRQRSSTKKDFQRLHSGPITGSAEIPPRLRGIGGNSLLLIDPQHVATIQ